MKKVFFLALLAFCGWRFYPARPGSAPLSDEELKVALADTPSNDSLKGALGLVLAAAKSEKIASASDSAEHAEGRAPTSVVDVVEGIPTTIGSPDESDLLLLPAPERLAMARRKLAKLDADDLSKKIELMTRLEMAPLADDDKNAYDNFALEQLSPTSLEQIPREGPESDRYIESIFRLYAKSANPEDIVVQLGAIARQQKDEFWAGRIDAYLKRLTP